MGSFFTGANLTWIIGILSSIVAGLSALSKFRYENKLQLFKDTNANIFKKEKAEVLAAISTLSVFKKDSRFEKHATNVLLSRLYTELDYDITNAICGALIQYSSRQELIDILSNVLDINRNFFIQTAPTDQRIRDVEKCWEDLNAAEHDEEKKDGLTDVIDSATDLAKKSKQSAGESLFDLEKSSSKELLETYRQSSLSLITKKRYELLWHKQITADTYSRILRRAYDARTRGWERIRQKYYKLIGAKRKYNRFKELDMNFYQNDFNYVFMAFFNTATCSIIRSAIASSTIVDVGFFNIGRISGSSFSKSTFYNCEFHGGHLKEVDLYGTTHDGVVFIGEDMNALLSMDLCSFNYSSFSKCTFKNCCINFSAFADCYFGNVLFENVTFNETYFCNANFVQVSFINCNGLDPRHFYKYYNMDEGTKLPSQVSRVGIDQLEKTATEKYILECPLGIADIKYLKSLFETLKK